MKLPFAPHRPLSSLATAALATAALLLGSAARGQDPGPPPPPPAAAPAAPAAGAPVPGALAQAAPPGPAAAVPPGAVRPGAATTQAAVAAPGEEVQISFSGANIDLVVKWLAEVTGKHVVKHKQVNCQLTIVSTRKLPLREGIGLVYRALALEGFSAVETSRSIFILPENLEPKVGAELVSGEGEGGFEGRQVLVRVFQLKNAPAGRLRDKVKGVLSDKGKIDVDDNANKIIATDFADNVRLLAELIEELDVAAVSETAIEIFVLKNTEAEDLARLLGSVFSEAGKGGAPAPPAPPPGGPPPPGGSQPSGPVTAGGEAVRIWADKTSNRLIVAASRKKLAEVRSLIELLDTEKPADVAVRVIPLVHVSAKDLVQEIAPLYQKIRGASLKELIEITANSRSNSLIVLSSEANFKALQTLVSSLDTKEAQEKAMRAFPLKNADSEDVAQQLQELHQGQEDDSYPYYYYRRREETSGKVRFVADRRRNTVIAIGPPGVMESVKDMISALDQPVEGENLAPRIYPLKFVSAIDIEELLNELFVKRRQRRGYWDYEYGFEERDRDIGRLYGKVRIASEAYTNAIIVTANSEESIQAVEAILKKLDQPSEAGESTLNVGLRFAKALTLSNSLNILFAKSGSPPRRPVQQQGQQPGQPGQQQPGGSPSTSFELEEEVQDETYFPWLGGQQEAPRAFDGRSTVRPVSDLVGRVRVVPDVRTNSLLISTNAHLFPQVMKVVNDLDVPTAQVLIEAKIVEVGSDFRERLGMRWSPDGKQVFDADDMDNSIMGSVDASYRQIFTGTALTDSLRTGILDAVIHLDFLIQFLRKGTDARVVAEPQINVADNERGKLFVGARVPFISNSLSTVEGGRNDSFQYVDVGIILEVTPHINTSDDVALKVRVESSNIRSGQTLFGGAILDTRNYRTDLVVKSGQTLILGGIIQREETLIERKTPILSWIPIIKWLFTKKDTSTRDVELMVFLRPTVTRTPQDVERLMREVERKTPQIQGWREALRQEREAREAELHPEGGAKAEAPPAPPTEEPKKDA